MSRQTILRVSTIALLLFPVSALSSAQDVPAPYGDVLKLLGRQGDFKDNVLKVNIPRNDVSVTVANVKTPTPFGFGGWIAMTKGTGMDVMMGDLVLLQDEVNPVMSALLDNGLEATALHNHFFWDEPQDVLHARAWTRRSDGPGSKGEAGARPDRPHVRAAFRRATRHGDAGAARVRLDRHGGPCEDRRC